MLALVCSKTEMLYLIQAQMGCPRFLTFHLSKPKKFQHTWRRDHRLKHPY